MGEIVAGSWLLLSIFDWFLHIWFREFWDFIFLRGAGGIGGRGEDWGIGELSFQILLDRGGVVPGGCDLRCVG